MREGAVVAEPHPRSRSLRVRGVDPAVRADDRVDGRLADRARVGAIEPVCRDARPVAVDWPADERGDGPVWESDRATGGGVQFKAGKGGDLRGMLGLK